MNKCVQLPFFIPDFATYHNTAIVDLACKDKPDAQAQLFNQRIELVCERDFLNGFSSPKITVPDANVYTFINLDRHCVSMIYAYPFYREIIREMINTGSYIYLSCIDDFYIPGKSWYKEKHRIHDGILCGYDDNDDTFTLAAYDSDWMFRLIRIPQESYEESMKAALESGNNVRLTAIVVRDNKTELNLSEIFKKIKAYSASDLQKFPIDGSGSIKGMAVYDYLELYFDKLLDQSIEHEKMDWRVMRIIWEYRACMQKRIEAVETKMGLENQASSEYGTIVKETDRLRMLYAFYHKKQKDSLMNTIRDNMHKIKEQEKHILETFLERMEKEIKS